MAEQKRGGWRLKTAVPTAYLLYDTIGVNYFLFTFPTIGKPATYSELAVLLLGG